MPKNLPPIVILCLLFGSPALWASQSAPMVLTTPQAERPGGMPARGSTMKQVKKTYGNPLQIIGPSGEATKSRPPITRWVYKNYIVYFENNRVIHSARPRPLEIIKFLDAAAPPPLQPGNSAN